MNFRENVRMYVGDFANYWQAIVPHPFRFGYHFVSVYYHLKEHYVNFSDFFKASLTTLYTHRIIEFSKKLICNHFLLGLWIKKKCEDVSLCKKVSAFWKKNTSPIAMQESTQNRKLTLKMCFWGSSATSILNFIYFFKSWDFFT